MWFHEHLARLKKYYSSKELRVPFVDGQSILKKIERHFIHQHRVVDDVTKFRYHYYERRWSCDMKRKVRVDNFPMGNIYDWIDRLDKDTNYWMVLAFGETKENQVFDCKPKAMQSLYSISRIDFFVIHKKYQWLAYFGHDKENDQFVFYRSGDTLTEFEVKK